MSSKLSRVLLGLFLRKLLLQMLSAEVFQGPYAPYYQGPYYPNDEHGRTERFLKLHIQLKRPTVTLTTSVFPTCYLTLPSYTSCSSSTTSTTASTQLFILARRPRAESWIIKTKKKTKFENNSTFPDYNNILTNDIHDSTYVQSSISSENLEQGRFFHRFQVRFSLSTVNGLVTKYSVALSTETRSTQTLLVGCTQAGLALSPACDLTKCSKDSDCNCYYPSCVGGFCKRCTQDSDCSSSKPYCYTPRGKCSACILPSQCDATSVCDIESGGCVSCNPSLWPGCAADFLVCDYTTNTCTSCKTDADCLYYSLIYGVSVLCTAGQCIP